MKRFFGILMSVSMVLSLSVNAYAMEMEQTVQEETDIIIEDEDVYEEIYLDDNNVLITSEYVIEDQTELYAEEELLIENEDTDIVEEETELQGDLQLTLENVVDGLVSEVKGDETIVETDCSEMVDPDSQNADGYIETLESTVSSDNENEGIGLATLWDGNEVLEDGYYENNYGAGTTSLSYFRVTYNQAATRKMVDLVNKFRTSNTWYWNPDNKSKTYVSGLSALKYDYALEKIAMQRAAEVAYNRVVNGRFEHYRPNGKSCFSLYNTMGYTYYAAGENIAYGYTSIESVFEAWKEENCNYSGQGHRRNMLYPSFTNFAVGHCYCNGVNYWVQLFTRAETSSNTAKWANGISQATVDIYTNGDGSINITPRRLGWVKLPEGWKYYKTENVPVVSSWIKLNEKWYRLNSKGIMLTGWNKVDGKWYYMNSNGVMQRGWILLNGKWYYLNPAGDMVTGWVKLNNKWYYLNSNGVMQTGWLKLDGKKYYLNSNGVMQTGWIKVKGKEYYMYKDGHMAKSTWIGNYHVNSNGVYDKKR